MTTVTDTRRSVEAVWRIESARVIAGLARMVHDVGLAEELAQDAMVAALEQWPESGIPRNPGAWLMTTAKRRAIDQFRRDERLAAKIGEIGRDLEGRPSDEPDIDDRLDDHIGDDLLRLVFTACHPVLSTEARVALTLRMLGGLSTPEIARAFLVPESTVAQRIVRAKKSLAKAAVPFEVPDRDELGERLASVLGVVYLIFNEGYSATAGDDWMRPALCEEAVRLARILTGLMPDEPEVLGLTALLEFQTSRFGARTDANGAPVLLDDQDRRRWDRLLIGRGQAMLDRIEALCSPHRPAAPDRQTAPERPAAPPRDSEPARQSEQPRQSEPARVNQSARTGEPVRDFGPYCVQAAIAGCHARAATAADTDWPQIAALYQVLGTLQPSPVVELNRAVAVSRAFGPAPALALVDALGAEPALRAYHLLPSVRGDLLQKLDRPQEARAEFERAAAMTDNAAQRALLLRRAEACAQAAAAD